MKLKPLAAISLIAILGAVLSVAGSTQHQDDPGVLLRAAIEKEEVDGDLQAAIEMYKKIVADHSDFRPIAAQALLRIGMCYEKLGNTEARKAYEDLLNRFADQEEFVSKARERLGALQSGPATTAPAQDSNLLIRRVPKLDMYAKPSPDGKYIAYVDWETGNLAIRNVTTGAERLLTKDGSWGDASSYAGFCVWSHDSNQIAFSWEVHSQKESRTELRVVSLEADSSPETISLPEATMPSWIYDWSLDNSLILCSLRGESSNTGTVLIDVKNNRIKRVNSDLNLDGSFQVLFTEEKDTILYSRPSAGMGTSNDIYLADLKTGRTSAIIEHPAEDLLVGMLPGTDWLLFVSNRRGRLDLWGVPFRKGRTSGPPMLIKQGTGRFFPLGFTSDGKYYYATLSVTDDVFFVDFNPETQEIIGEPRKLVSPWEGANMGARFSQDGRSLAYVTRLSPMPIPTHTADSLVVQSLEDTNAEPLVIGFNEFHLRRVAGPRWESEGKSILLAGWQGDQQALYRVNLKNLKKEKIYSVPEDQRVSDHECTEKTGFTYFIKTDKDQTTAVICIDSDGGTERQIFRAPQGQRISQIALSPDDNLLSIEMHLDTNNRALLVMPSEGGVPRRVHEFLQRSGGGVPHTWAPDGKSILYIILEKEEWTWGIHLIPADGSDNSKTLMKYKNPFYGIAFHPNGRILAFTARNGASSDAEVWVMENLREKIKMLASRIEIR